MAYCVKNEKIRRSEKGLRAAEEVRMKAIETNQSRHVMPLAEWHAQKAEEYSRLAWEASRRARRAAGIAAAFALAAIVGATLVVLAMVLG